ncbi:MarR family transcriptional regulator, partial [Citrobacter freundii]|nr:MarR family transcriptional regulator [Citrobacter freundii]
YNMNGLTRGIDQINWLHHKFKTEVNCALVEHNIPLTLSKLRVLDVIAHTPHCRAKEIIEILGFSPRTVTEALDYLDIKGFILRKKSKENRKDKILSLTQRGDSILSIAIEIRMAKLHELIEPLTEEQLMQLIHLSDVLYNASRSFNS